MGKLFLSVKSNVCVLDIIMMYRIEPESQAHVVMAVSGMDFLLAHD